MSVAVLLRLLALAGDPGTSDDVYRYIWEGGLIADGQSPWARAPDAPALAPYREAWPGVAARLNNPDVSAAYPPGMQVATAAVVHLAGGPGADDGERARFWLRAFFATCDLVLLVPLMALLRRRGRSPAWAVAWGWCPLVVLEFAGAGHYDSLGVLALMGALALGTSRTGGAWHRRAGRALLVASALVKLLPLGLFPFAARGACWQRRLGGMGLAFVLAWVPIAFLEGGFAGLGRGLSEYGLRWESTSLVYRWIEPLFAFGFERDGSWHDPRRLGRMAVGVLWVAWLVRSWRRGDDLVLAAAAAAQAFCVLSPTLHPWYLSWVIPFLALTPSLAWTFLVALAPLFYGPLEGWWSRGEWTEPAWLWPGVVLPFLVLLLLEARSNAWRARWCPSAEGVEAAGGVGGGGER